jgi:hypothetical protein
MKQVATKESQRKASPSPASPPKRRQAQPRGGTPAAPAAPQPDPAHEQLVREAAYFIYERSGRIDGRELENWLQAEAELVQPAGTAPRPRSKRPG